LDYWIIGFLDDWIGGKRTASVPSIHQSINPCIHKIHQAFAGIASGAFGVSTFLMSMPRPL
jgi:hypothetical protein